MSESVSRRIIRQVDEAEQRQILYRPQSSADVRACRRRVQRGEFVEPFPLLFGRAGTWRAIEPWQRPYRIIHSLALQEEGLIFCAFSAACVFGLPVSLELLRDVYIAVPSRSHTGKTGRFVRCAVLPSPGMPTFGRGHVGDICVTSPERTVVGCLCMAPFPQALAIADASLRFLRIERDRLIELVELYGGKKRGIANARRVARYADARSESGGESIARGVMIEEGFVVPDLQIEFPNVLDPWKPFYVDGAWFLPDGTVKVFEFDGKDKYTRFAGRSGDTVAKMMRERQRESRLTAVCDAVIRFDYRDVMTPGRLARILDAFGIPRVTDEGRG